MIQNSLDRVLDGLAESLSGSVLPEVRDPYARAQVESAVDLLRNLAERVEWRCDQLEEAADTLRPTLEAAVAAAPAATELAPVRRLLAEPEPVGNADLVRRRSASLEMFALVQRWHGEQRTVPAEPLQDTLTAAALAIQRQEYGRMRAARRRPGASLPHSPSQQAAGPPASST